ncbi:MAG: group III truncated hemoglobin [Bacteroidia bacterium]
MKPDISTFDDIKLLVQSFYTKAREDDTIGFFFSDVIPINWEDHFPRMYQFWESVLLGGTAYRGNPMIKHIHLHRKAQMEEAHFERWITLWKATVNEHFEGEIATKAIVRATTIKDLMQWKVGNVVL